MAILIFSGNVTSQSKGKDNVTEKIDAYINSILKDHEIPGIALAVIKDGKVLHKNYYGKASIEHDVPVDRNTIFRVYSTTKLITATGIFQLIEKKKISLEDNVLKYIEDLPESWKAVKIKHLLTHSSGLPELEGVNNLSKEEIAAKTFEQHIRFQPGERFWYTQTNYWLLKQIIEKITGTKFEDYILQNQFSPSKKGVLFSSNSYEIIPHRATRYGNDNGRGFEALYFFNLPLAHSGNGLNITLDEFIEWNQKFDKGQLIKDETKSQMWSEFDFKNGDKFLYGWGVYPVNKRLSYGFSGGNVTAFRKFVQDDLTVILLTNGYKYLPAQDFIIDHVAGIVDDDLADEKSLLKERVISNFVGNNFQSAKAAYTRLKNKYPSENFEGSLNSLGYGMTSAGRLDDALEIFKLNVQEHPNSWNVWDSLGEAYFANKNYELSLTNYKKSLELNPENKNAEVMIKKIGEIVTIEK